MCIEVPLFLLEYFFFFFLVLHLCIKPPSHTDHCSLRDEMQHFPGLTSGSSFAYSPILNYHLFFPSSLVMYDVHLKPFLQFRFKSRRLQVLFKMTADCPGCWPDSRFFFFSSAAPEAPWRMFGGGEAAVPGVVGVVSSPKTGAWFGSRLPCCLDQNQGQRSIETPRSPGGTLDLTLPPRANKSADGCV